jgi:hypothetical protein
MSKKPGHSSMAFPWMLKAVDSFHHWRPLFIVALTKQSDREHYESSDEKRGSMLLYSLED